MATVQQPRQFHPLPVIGHPEAYYTKHIHQAEAAGDTLARSAHKVGQYVTIGLDPNRSWEEKVKHFRHTLKHHCSPPADADEATRAFCAKLQDLVLRYASQEARRLARQEHDGYAMRLEMGVPRDVLSEEAEVFFPNLLGHGSCPEFMTPEAFNEIRGLRDHWM
jgi:hypothetical protein